MSREVDILILGLGWTAEFLVTLLTESKIPHAATTRDGRNNTIKFTFDPTSDDLEPFHHLPRSRLIVITFPLKGPNVSGKLMDMYWKAKAPVEVNWILLGSTGIYKQEGWSDRDSPYDKENPRAIAEDELLAKDGVVLSLAGLYSDTTRIPKTWVKRVAKSKEDLKNKDSLHLIHGEDVARAILQTHKRFTAGERWLITDRHVYDWWDLVDAWGDELTEEWDEEKDGPGPRPEYRKWVEECMLETEVKALPRTTFKRMLDSRDFWKTMKILPQHKLTR